MILVIQWHVGGVVIIERSQFRPGCGAGACIDCAIQCFIRDYGRHSYRPPLVEHRLLT